MIVKFDSLNRMEPPALYLCGPNSKYSDAKLSDVIGGLVDTEAEENIFNFNAPSELNLRVNYPENVFMGSEEDFDDSSIVIEDSSTDIYVDGSDIVIVDGATIVGKTLIIDNTGPARVDCAINAYEALENRRLIFMKNIGYFVITHVEETNAGRTRYKDISAQSVEKEIEQKEVPFIEDGTYPFSTVGLTEGMFDKIMSVLPSWTVDHIDSEVASKYRTFEDVGLDLNCYSFMINDMQDAYECIFEFDIINRQVSVYDRANYVDSTSIRISNNDVINTLKISEDSEDLYTAINVSGDNDLGIAAVNPLGTNTIYDFSHYLSWMSTSLRIKISGWMSDVRSAESAYLSLNEDYYTELQSNSTLRLNIEAIDTQISMYKRCRDNVVASQAGEDTANEHTVDMTELYNEAIEALGGIAITVSIDEQIADLLTTIDGLISGAEAEKATAQAGLATSNSTLATLSASITSIIESLSLTSALTVDEYEELSKFIFEGTYTDEYVTITDIMTYTEKFEQMKTLYDRAVSQLEKISKPKQDFTVDVESFIFEKDFGEWTEQLETGCLIDVEIDKDEVASLFLSSITVNYDDKSMSLKFGSRYDKYDTVSLFEDVLGSVSKSANSINYIKDTIYPIKEGEIDKLREAINNARALSMANALSAQNQAFVIDGAGITGKKVNENNPSGYDDEQVKMTSNLIVFTDDAWQTCKVAIGNIGDGKYGINADTIIGNLIIGNDLILSGTLRAANDSFYLNMDTGELRMDKLWAEDIENAKDDMSGVVDQKIEENNTSSKAIIDGLQAQLDNLTSNGIFSKFTIESDGVHIGYKSQDASQPGGEIVIDGSTIWFKIGENSKAYINAAGFNFDYGILTTALTIGHENDGTETDGEWTWMKSQSGHFRLVYKG